MYTYVIFNNGREVENIDAGEYETRQEAEAAGLEALDYLCPKGSPNRRFYRVDAKQV